ncbi:MAG: response regulator, partial [Alphaproteobacteria bacterium]|nr:response regulator [Alphaproteobacteria bacterium]
MAKILIAEHNSTTAAYLAATLKKAGNTVESVDNCLDAWRVSSRDSYDVLLVNVVMPGIDGFVLAQKALQDNPGLQVIFITGFAGVAMDT